MAIFFKAAVFGGLVAFGLQIKLWRFSFSLR
jgi:hypothetical protein